MTDRIGPVLAPTHPAPLHSLVDHRLARRLDVTRADLPARRHVPRVVHPIHVVADVLRHLTMDLQGRLRSTGPDQSLQRLQGRHASLVLERVAPLVGQDPGGVGVAGMPRYAVH